MSLQPRKRGETQAQYNRRVGTKRPRTVGRPTTIKQKPVRAVRVAKPDPRAVTVIGKKPPTQKVRATVDPDRRRPIVKKPTVDPRKQKRIGIPKGKPTDATIDYFDKDGKRIIKSVQPDRRTPRPKRPTRDGVKTDAGITRPDRRRPPRTPTPKLPDRRKPPRMPKNRGLLASIIEDLRRRQKDKRKGPTTPRPLPTTPRPLPTTPRPLPKKPPKRDPKLIIPDTFKGYKKISAAEAGFKGPPRGSYVTQAFQTFHNPTTGQMVTVPTGGYTAPKGWIRGRPKDEFYRKPVAIRPGLTDPSGRPIQPRVPRRPPDPLGGRDFRDLNRQERAEVIKQRYQLSQTERMRRYNDARQRVMDRFRNDPIKLRQELSKLNVQIRQSDTVEKFRAGLVNANALRKVGIPPRDIRGITFQRRMSVMPESPRKLDMMLNFQIRQMNVDLRERIKRMQAQGATRQEIQRLKISYFNQVARLRQNIAKAKADLQTDRRRRLSAIMGPR